MPWKFFWETFVVPKNGTAHSPVWYAWAGSSILFLWLAFWWSVGMLPAFGAGFAKADDVKAIQTSLLEASILDLRIRYCSAPTGTDVKIFFSQQTQEKVRLYKIETGTVYNLPDCKDLVYVATVTDNPAN